MRDALAALGWGVVAVGVATLGTLALVGVAAVGATLVGLLVGLLAGGFALVTCLAVAAVAVLDPDALRARLPRAEVRLPRHTRSTQAEVE